MATSTIGLMAGADSRNATAAPGETPRRIRVAATGTDPHSHPGNATPASPATGTAKEGRRGSARWKNDAGTATARTVDTATPNMMYGEACTQIATKTVNQAATAGADSRSGASTLSASATTSTATSASTDRRRDAGTA